MAISMNSVKMNKNANEMFRNAVNNELYKQSIVITKIELHDLGNGNIQEEVCYGTVGDTPLLRAF